jgi:methionyl-tRNA formyltransferase
MRPAASPVKRLALERGIDVFQPPTLKSADVLHRLRESRPEVIVVAAYGLLLPQAVLEAAPYGALNIHASLLPRWRGAAPIQRALLAGDRETGVSIMQMDAGLDTGPLLLQRRLPIADDEDAGTLHDKLAVLGAEAMAEVLDELKGGRCRAVPQPEAGATYARKIERHETQIDWSRPARDLERLVRALRPAPGAVARVGSELLKIWRSQVVVGRGGPPGEVLDIKAGLLVACGEQALRIQELQRAGGRRLSADEFLRGHALPPGVRLT